MAYADMYNRAGGISGLGIAFKEFVMNYKSVFDPEANSYLKGKPIPPAYIANLMGDYTVSSMFMQYPGEPTLANRVKMGIPAFHIARVVNDIHRQMMGTLQNIRYSGTEPDATLEKLLQRDDVKGFIRRYQQGGIEMMKGNTTGMKTSADDMIIYERVIDEMVEATRPKKMPMLTFKFKDGKTEKEVQVPNIPVGVQDPSDEILWTKLRRGMPLACIAWGLGKATDGKLLTDKAAPFINYTVGTQHGLTMSVDTMIAALQQKPLPELEGRTVESYLVKNGSKLSETVHQEAHHMLMLRAMRMIEQKDVSAIEDILTAADVAVGPPSLRQNYKYIARDVACLLYATASAFERVYKKMEESKDQKIKIAKGELEKNDYSTDMRRMINDLKTMADAVSQFKEPQEVIGFLKGRAVYPVLNDAIRRVPIIYRNVSIDLDVGPPVKVDISLGLRLIRNLIPDVRFSVPIAPRDEFRRK